MPSRTTPIAVALAILTAIASPVSAAPSRERPWGRGTMQPTFGFGLGLGRDATQLGFGLGFRYFVVGGLGVGLSLSDSITIFSSSLKNDFPGVNKQIPTNTFRITPSLQYVFYRSRWFSPYAHAGVGPAIFNNGGGVVGQWVAGPGAYIGIGGPVYLNVGVDFSSMFPRGKCDRAYRYEAAGSTVQFEGYCGFSWGPNIGLVVAFGGGRGKRRASPPPDNPMPDAVEPDTRPFAPDPIESPATTPGEDVPAAPATTVVEPAAPAPAPTDDPSAPPPDPRAPETTPPGPAPTPSDDPSAVAPPVTTPPATPPPPGLAR
jgi:hypothetical protein